MTTTPSPLPRRWAMELISVAAVVVVLGLPVLALLLATMLVGGVALITTHWNVAIFGAPLIGPPVRAALRVAAACRVRRNQPAAGIDVGALQEPGLHALVLEEATRCGVARPDAVHVTLDHAIAVVRTRAPGVRPRRVLTVGAPVAVELTTPELRVAITEALLRDRDALGRALADPAARLLVRAGQVAQRERLAGAPWRAFVARAYRLRCTAVRARTLWVDHGTARRHGTEPVLGWLRAVAREGAYADYWRADVVRCLRSGYRPEILAGWRRRLAEPAAADGVASDAYDFLTARGSSPDDPFPALGDRAAVAEEAGLGTRRLRVRSGPRWRFRSDEDALAAALLGGPGREAAARELVALPWSRVADAVWLPALREDLRDAPGALGLGRATVADLEMLVRRTEGESLELVAASLAVALADAGWEMDVSPGVHLTAHRGEHTFEPLAVPFMLATGSLQEREDWASLIHDAGIALLPMATAPPIARESAGPLASVELGSVLVPPRPPVSLRLRQPAALRRRTAAILTAGLALGVPLAVLYVVEALLFTGPWPLHAALVAVGVTLAVGLGLWTRSRVRYAWSEGTLTVTHEGLTIAHPTLLQEPFHVPRTLVRTVAIDDDAHRRDLRLPVTGTPWDHPGSLALAAATWLWTANTVPLVPTLTVADSPPNVALVFTEALLAPRVRRVDARGPQPGDEIAGLLLAVDDVATVTRVLGEWGVVRPVDLDDLHLIDDRFEAPLEEPFAPAMRVGRPYDQL